MAGSSFLENARKGPLKDEALAARHKVRLLLVFLYTDDNPFTEEVLRFLDTDADAARLINQNFIPWAASVDTSEGYEAMTRLQVSRLPSLVVTFGTRVVMRAEGPVTPWSLIPDALRRALDDTAGDLAKEVAFQTERMQRDALRAQQEQALAEAEKRDRARLAAIAADKAAKNRAEQEAKEAAEREKALRKASEEEAERQRQEASRAAEELELRRAAALSALPEEPAEDTPNIVHIKLVLPNGTAMVRRFHETEPVRLLFTLTESAADFDGRPFDLKTGFPPRALDPNTNDVFKTVKVLCPRSVVTVSPKLL